MFAENGIQLTMKHGDCTLITWYSANVNSWMRIRFDNNMFDDGNADNNHCMYRSQTF